MGILGRFFGRKLGHSGGASIQGERVQGQYFDAILGEKRLYEQVGALCSMDILEYFLPLPSHDDHYTYSMEGKVFAKDGCGGHYVLLDDGGIGYINTSEDECGRVADSLKDLFELELNCAYSWHNYLNKKYLEDPSRLKGVAASLELEGRGDFEDAYGEAMPEYTELQKEVAEKLALTISFDITEDILPRLYQAVQRQPEFLARSKTDSTCLGKLYK